jgi:hypothetical protein
MFISGPDFYPSRIPDLGTRIQQRHQKRREIFFSVLPFLESPTSVINNFIFEQVTKNFLSQNTKNYNTLKFVVKLSKIWVWYPESKIQDPKNLFRIPDPGSKRHRIPDPDPQHCLLRIIPSRKYTRSLSACRQRRGE